jgi:hypothetical protein
MDSKCENYCAMDNAQCYPEYLITYCWKLKRGFLVH